MGAGLLAGAVACLPVGVIAGLVREQVGPLVDLDQRLIVAATDVTREHPGLLKSLLVWQEAFVPLHTYLLTVPFLVLAWRRGLRGRAVWGLATMLVGWNLGLDVKLLVQRVRPLLDNPVSSAPGYSFPSGHVFNMTMACAATLVVMWPLLARTRPAARVAALALAAVLVVSTMLDRVFLGVHFPSDTVAGVLLALALTYASWVGYSGSYSLLRTRRTSHLHAERP